MSAIEELLHRNAHRPEKGPGELSHRPALRVAILTCMDARLDLGALFGLRPGEAHVLRNAGGTLTDDTIRSLAISQRRLGTREILLVHHTGCGMTTFTDEDFAFDLDADPGLRPPWKARTFVTSGRTCVVAWTGCDDPRSSAPTVGCAVSWWTSVLAICTRCCNRRRGPCPTRLRPTRRLVRRLRS